MLVIPAIDIRNGSCVRLVQGDPKQMTVYSNHPLETATKWKEKGAGRIHIIDLDGAFDGVPKNLDVVGQIKKSTGCQIQFGGGLRSYEAIERAFDLGIDQLIIGTAALEAQDWVVKALQDFPGRFIASIDAWNNQVTKLGWQKGTLLEIGVALEKMEKMGFESCIYTDISRDGTLEGPNIPATERVIAQTKMGVYASGGVSSLKDIQALRQVDNLRGVVVGKALYNGNLELEDCF